MKTNKDKTTNPLNTSSIKNYKKNFSSKIYYSFLTVFISIFLFIFLRGIYVNAVKSIVLSKKLKTLEQIHKEAQDENIKLKEELKNYSSKKGIEELARDNLNMVGKDEVLVIIQDGKEKLD